MNIIQRYLMLLEVYLKYHQIASDKVRTASLLIHGHGHSERSLEPECQITGKSILKWRYIPLKNRHKNRPYII